MKNVRKAIYELLRDDATVSAIVVSGSQTRIYPISLPQGITSPSVVYTVITEDTDYNMNGSSGLVKARMTIDAIAPSQSAAFDLADAAKNVLSGFRGLVSIGSNSPQDQIIIRGIFHDSTRDLFDPTARLYSCQHDYLVSFGEY